MSHIKPCDHRSKVVYLFMFLCGMENHKVMDSAAVVSGYQGFKWISMLYWQDRGLLLLNNLTETLKNLYVIGFDSVLRQSHH